MQSIVLFLTMLVSVAVAFHASGSVRPARLSMLFGGKKSSSSSGYQVGKGSANKGAYIPDGLSPEEYNKKLQAEAATRAAKMKKFPKGKEVLSLTDWMLQEKAKGLEGRELLKKGHRMVKAKYDGWYTDYSPVP
jgi:hypothetical protein